MNEKPRKSSHRIAFLLFAAAFVVVMSTPAFSAGYDNALKGVKSYDAVYEVTMDNPKFANIVFWAVKNSYEVAEVKALANPAKIAVVFHGPAVKMLSSDKTPFDAAAWAEVEKFQETLRQMKKDGVSLEVCAYAVEVMGVDKARIMPEIDIVGNGFVSVIGYQMQGYAVVRVP
jgi:intracellular sulfur oxidation DsrE/DsrF family protein